MAPNSSDLSFSFDSPKLSLLSVASLLLKNGPEASERGGLTSRSAEGCSDRGSLDSCTTYP